MAFLAKARKEDLRRLADELGESPSPNSKIIDLKNLIMKSESYEEDFVKTLLETIVTDRKEEERLEMEAKEKKERLEMEGKERKERMEFELEKLKIEAQRTTEYFRAGGENNGASCHELVKIMPKFDFKDGDIVLYLSLFERQARRIGVDVKDWVSSLLNLLPSEIVSLIARESEESFEDYVYIKNILLKRFKMNPESFRQKFVQHQKSPGKSWRDFTFEITNYFKEWIDGLEIEDFNSLKDLMITDQVKRRVPGEVREHFLDNWTTFISPLQLADKLDEYESIRTNHKKSNANVPKEKQIVKWRPRSPPEEKPFKSKNMTITHNTQKTQGSHQGKTEGMRRSYRPTCYSCGDEGHISRVCPAKNGSNGIMKRAPSHTAQSNVIRAPHSIDGLDTPILSAKITAPVSATVERKGDVDELITIQVKCGTAAIQGIIDIGAQISVIRADLVAAMHHEGESRLGAIWRK